jgi:NADP-dependent 3-hydroxy acid dehydrogenase YdfG
MQTQVEGKLAIITGASSGIGEATAKALAKIGINVAIAARREEKLNELKDFIEKNNYPGKCFVSVTDVTKREQVKLLVQSAEQHFGRPVDILINNAGIAPLSFLKNLHEIEWEQMIDVNIKGALNAIAAVLPSMLKNNKGDIINVSSDAGRKIFPTGVVYCATKHALEAITNGLRLETEGTKIKVTSIQPGYTKSEIGNAITDEEVKQWFSSKSTFPPLESEDVANAIVFTVCQPPHCSIDEILLRPVDQRS